MRNLSEILLRWMFLPLIIWSFSCTSRTEQEDTNMAALEGLYELGINERDVERIKDYLVEDYVRHCQSMPWELQEINKRSVMLELYKAHFESFPDWKEELTILAVDGDRIAFLSKGKGTQYGAVGELPATRKTCELHQLIVHRFEDGKIAESWVSFDNLDMLRQLGHLGNL